MPVREAQVLQCDTGERVGACTHSLLTCGCVSIRRILISLLTFSSMPSRLMELRFNILTATCVFVGSCTATACIAVTRSE